MLFNKTHCRIKSQGSVSKITLLALFALAAGVVIYVLTDNRVSEYELAKLENTTTLLFSPKQFPEFSLTDHNGQHFTKSNLSGHWNFIFFGFTHCPDVCPLTLSQMDQVIDNLQKDANNVQGIFISVDPNRDTADKLKNYVEHFNPKMVGLTGSYEKLDELTKDLGVVYTSAPDTTENYLVDHSAHIFLVAPNGTLAALFSTPHENKLISKNFQKISQYYNYHTKS